MFVIIGICVWVIPNGEVRKIKHLRVFFITAFWSIFAYIWLYLILDIISPGIVEVCRSEKNVQRKELDLKKKKFVTFTLCSTMKRIRIKICRIIIYRIRMYIFRRPRIKTSTIKMIRTRINLLSVLVIIFEWKVLTIIVTQVCVF